LPEKPHHEVTPEMRESFINMVQFHQKSSRREAENYVNDYEQKSIFVREQERKPIVEDWLRSKGWRSPQLELRKQPFVEAPPYQAPKLEKPKPLITGKFVEQSEYKTSMGDLNPRYVQSRGEQDLRFVPLGGTAEHYYDLKTDRELNRRQYDEVRKKEGRFL